MLREPNVFTYERPNEKWLNTACAAPFIQKCSHKKAYEREAPLFLFHSLSLCRMRLYITDSVCHIVVSVIFKLSETIEWMLYKCIEWMWFWLLCKCIVFCSIAMRKWMYLWLLLFYICVNVTFEWVLYDRLCVSEIKYGCFMYDCQKINEFLFFRT